MPCLGPTPQEEREMELRNNEKRYGLYLSDLDITTRVACHLANGESNELTKAWIREHRKEDKRRRNEEFKVLNSRRDNLMESIVNLQQELAEVNKKISTWRD